MSQADRDVSGSTRDRGETFYFYHYANFRIQTTTAIVGLTPYPCRHPTNSPVRDVFLQEAEIPIGILPPVLFRWPGRYGLSLHHLPNRWLFRTISGCEFQVSADGQHIHCYPGNTGWNSETSDIFVRRVLPRVVQLHGTWSFHGAGLVYEDLGILLLGKSHAGKSTLATALSQRSSWQLLADDVVVTTAPEFRLLPGSPSVSLWDDSAAALATAYTFSEVLSAYQTKYRCDVAATADRDETRLHAVYLLEPWRPNPGDLRGPQIAEMPLRERLSGLAAHSIRFNPADTEEEVRRQRNNFRLATRVVMGTLRYPQRYDVFPEVATLLEATFPSASLTLSSAA